MAHIKTNSYLSKISAVFFIFWFAGCATIGGSHQDIKVTSHPQGAEVFYNGELLGHTPGIFSISRGKTGSLLLKKPGLDSVNVPLSSSYRWGDSFGGNFVFLYLAPLGWGLDLLDKSAWRFSSPLPVHFDTAKKKEIEEPPLVIAIAPPQLNFELLSDEIGEKLEAIVRKKYPGSQVLPYDKTLDAFSTFSYDNTQVSPRESRTSLYKYLGVTHLVESQVARKNDQIIVDANLNDIYSDQLVEHFSTTFSKSQLKAASQSSVTEALLSTISIVPNDISFDVTSGAVTIANAASDGSQSYLAYPDIDNSALSYISGIGFHSVNSPRLYNNIKPIFRFVPDITASYNHIHFSRQIPYDDLYGIGFSWYKFLVGIGPELGLDTSAGYFYFQFLPLYGLDYVHWEKANQSFDSNSAGFDLELELGYLFFVSDRLNLKLFGRVLSGQQSQWSNILSQVSGRSIIVNNVNSSIFGFSIGYYFSGAKNEVKKWFK